MDHLNNAFCGPNPANGRITISNPFDKIATLNIYNMAGSLVKQSEISGEQTELSLKYLPEGIYIFLMESEGTVIRNKVVLY